MRRLLARIWAILARADVLPVNAFCRSPMRTWLRGAETRKPYIAILTALALMCALPSARTRAESSFDTFVGDPDRLLPRTSCKKDSVPINYS